jgi:hypothetical protein
MDSVKKKKGDFKKTKKISKQIQPSLVQKILEDYFNRN